MSEDLDRRLTALAEAVELADGRLDPERVDRARRVVQRAGKRVGLGIETTVVALAGPTGAGKSSLFNSLAGAELVQASRRRPTTSTAAAAVWGEPADPLLDWLEVPLRHRVGDGRLDGLVLLDLPDFDSVEESHRLEVDRVIELVDLLVWVVDPQKYADATLHERYLRRLSSYEEVMVVVLNQADLLAEDALLACRTDLARLLAGDGLDGVPVLGLSALTGAGLPALCDILQKRVAERGVAVTRLAADVSTVTAALSAEYGAGAKARVDRIDRARLTATLAEVAGVPTVVRAVEAAHRRRGALEGGWPFVRWVRRMRPDPLGRLRLGDDAEADVRTSLPGPTPLQRSQAASATRALAAGAAGELPGPWPGLVRTAATASEDRLADRLDRAVSGADLRMRRPRWWWLAGVAQKALAVAAVAGAAWLLVLALLGYFLQLDDVIPLPKWEGIPIPTLLLGGGLLAGLLLAGLARLVNSAAARRRGRVAGRALNDRVEQAAAELVIAPVEAELSAREQLGEALAIAAGSGHRWARRPRAGRAGSRRGAEA